MLQRLACLALFVAALAGSALADKPNEGAYTFSAPEMIYKITLTRAKGGNFTVGGIVYGSPVKGTLFGKTLKLKATAKSTSRGGKVREFPVEGYWDSKDNTLIVTVRGTDFQSHNEAKEVDQFMKQQDKERARKNPPKTAPQVKQSETFGLVKKVTGTVPGPWENQGWKVSGSMSETTFSVSVQAKPPYEGSGSVTHTFMKGALGPTLKPGDIIELTVSSNASHAGPYDPNVGSSASWEVLGSVEILEKTTSFAGIGGSGFTPMGSGKTRFKVLSGGTITIWTKHAGYTWGSSDNWTPVTYVYEFGKRPAGG